MHGESKSHDGTKRISTLLNEKGNIELFRVSEETRQKVKEETEKIRKDTKRHLEVSKKQIAKEEHERLKATEDSRHEMTLKWIHKTLHSPFNENLLTSLEKRSDRYDKITSMKKTELKKQNILDSMTGLPKFEECPKEKILNDFKNFETQIALEYRLKERSAKVIQKEKLFVDSMLESELFQLKEKFPKLKEKLIYHPKNEDALMKFTNTITVPPESNYKSDSKVKKTLRRKSPVGYLPYEEHFKDFLDAEKIEFYDNEVNEPSFYHDDSTEGIDDTVTTKYIAPKLTTDINF